LLHPQKASCLLFVALQEKRGFPESYESYWIRPPSLAGTFISAQGSAAFDSGYHSLRGVAPPFGVQFGFPAELCEHLEIAIFKCVQGRI